MIWSVESVACHGNSMQHPGSSVRFDDMKEVCGHDTYNYEQDR